MNKNFYIGVGIIAVGVIALGGYLYPKYTPTAGSPTSGATFNTAKIAAININPQSVTSTSTSLYNGDANDRIVTDGFVTCSGLADPMNSISGPVKALYWYAATSSVAAPTVSVANSSFNAINATLATTTSDGFVATSTYAFPYARRWNSGTYMIFQTNATSSAEVCNVGVHYLAL